ncbi:MAG: hypothetical protein JKY65_24570 [Planctomycetes bacterium]|nr:hypothetical protein [Planctomycetota bacterium]
MGWTRNIPVSYYEKIALLLLAAKLEGEGYSVRLSVRQPAFDSGNREDGIDWAQAVAAVQRLGRAFDRKQDDVAGAYASVALSKEERSELRSGLYDLLRGWVKADRAYRYDGIWHDHGGNLDLVAWRGEGTLVVEAKGVTLKNQDDPSINWAASARKAGEDVVGKGRDVSWRTRPQAQHGLLFPAPTDAAISGKFFTKLALAWPEGRPKDERTPIFLVDSTGEIQRTTATELFRE